MEPEKLELESTHPETLTIYTHTLKRSGCFFLLTTNTTALFFISIYLHSYGCHTTRLPQGIKIVECFLSVFFPLYPSKNVFLTQVLSFCLLVNLPLFSTRSFLIFPLPKRLKLHMHISFDMNDLMWPYTCKPTTTVTAKNLFQVLQS